MEGLALDVFYTKAFVSFAPDLPEGVLRTFNLEANPGANLKSVAHRCYLREVAFKWELTKETINLPLSCLQGGSSASSLSVPVSAQVASPSDHYDIADRLHDAAPSIYTYYICYHFTSLQGAVPPPTACGLGKPNPAKFTHRTMAKVVWTITPSIILTVTAVPSLALLPHL